MNLCFSEVTLEAFGAGLDVLVLEDKPVVPAPEEAIRFFGLPLRQQQIRELEIDDEESIVLHDRLRDSKQRRLLAKVPFPRALLLPYLALMPLTSFHGHKNSNEQADHGANSERQADSDD